MKLPAADDVLIEPAKLRDYLLSSEHPIGRAKAHFFRTLGFTQATWTQLEEALRVLARTGEAELSEPTAFGQKYLVRGMLQGPWQRADTVTVWIVLHGEAVPRFVTAYPGASS